MRIQGLQIRRIRTETGAAMKGKRRIRLERALFELESARRKVQRDINRVQRLLRVAALRRRGLNHRLVCGGVRRDKIG